MPLKMYLSCVHPRCRAGFEARGLIFGAPLALALNAAFVPLRKPGKLPGRSCRGGHTWCGHWAAQLLR